MGWTELNWRSKMLIENIRRSIRYYLVKGHRYGNNCDCQPRKSHVAFQLAYLYFIFKIRRIFTMNISQTVTYYTGQTYMKSHIVFRLACLHLTVTISKGHAYFDCGYLANWETGHTLLLLTNMKPHMAFRFIYLHLTLTQGHAHYRCEYLTNGYIYDKYCCGQQMWSRTYGLSSGIYKFIFTLSKIQCQVHAHFDCEYLANRVR